MRHERGSESLRTCPGITIPRPRVQLWRLEHDVYRRALPRAQHSQPTPQTTVEAIMVAVRARGLAALEEAANVERLVRCDQVARRQINERITRLYEQGSRR